MAIAEHYIEAIADKLNRDPDDVRLLNLYKEGRSHRYFWASSRKSVTSDLFLIVTGEKTPYHQQVLDWHVPRMLKDCRAESEYDRRRAEIDVFNKEHNWRKRGIALLPTKFGVRLSLP